MFRSDPASGSDPFPPRVQHDLHLLRVTLRSRTALSVSLLPSCASPRARVSDPEPLIPAICTRCPTTWSPTALSVSHLPSGASPPTRPALPHPELVNGSHPSGSFHSWLWRALYTRLLAQLNFSDLCCDIVYRLPHMMLKLYPLHSFAAIVVHKHSRLVVTEQRRGPLSRALATDQPDAANTAHHDKTKHGA